ncbi:MAG: hypothetical protein NXI31_05015 [bacterium]|nr:hypothetical protein [bacterium]
MKTSLKLLAAVSALTAVLAFVFPSYAATVFALAKDEINDQVPIEFEIERATELVAAIEPQIVVCKSEVARAEVDLENLGREVESLTVKIAKAEHSLRRDADLLGLTVRRPADGVVILAGGPDQVTGARDRVALRLKRAFQRVKNERAQLDSKRALHERQQKSVVAAREKLDAVRSEKLQLEDLIAQLRVQKRQVDALEARSPTLDLDATALSEARAMLDDLKNRLDVRQRVLENDLVVEPEPLPPTISAEALLEDVGEYLTERAVAGS